MLGSFDGLHRGHQRILRDVVRRARLLKATPAALVFDMPPRLTRRHPEERHLVTTLAEKKEALAHLGIQRVQLLTFDRRLASTSPEDFFKHMIVRRQRAVEMVVGPRVAFGKNRAGKLPLLRQLGKKYGVRIRVIRPIGSGASAVSSSRIREMLQAGDIVSAARLLGRPYGLAGRVVHGAQRGRKLGFPTLNVNVEPGKILPPGVFAVYFHLGTGSWRLGLCNIGTRPTFTPDEKKPHVEVFSLSALPGKAYGRSIEITFARRIRAEKRFDRPSALIAQIRRDVAWARRHRRKTPLHSFSHSI
jgi:riboflavin kinase/FMN adenylyltransferase